MNDSDRAAIYEAEEEFYSIEFNGDYDELETLFHENQEEGARMLSENSPLSEREAFVLLCRLYGFDYEQ